MTFGSRELGDLVAPGRVEPDRVRLWARLAAAGRHVVDVYRHPGPSGGSIRLEIEPDSPASDRTGAWWVSGLEPDTGYRVDLLRDGERVAAAEFRTAPVVAPPHWTFAAFSCHQPFAKDGTPLPEAESMLSATREALATESVRFVLMMGDQIYADRPAAFSLFDENYFPTIAPPGRASLRDCTREEIRAIYQLRYRQFWGLAGFPALQSAAPCFPMLDDHEVVDNFGTNVDHAQPGWEEIRHGALDAYFDYQAARVLERSEQGRRPEHFDYGFTWGQAAFWMMDIRSGRRTIERTTTCFEGRQLEALRSFVHDHRHLPLLVVTTAIPLVHVEGWLADLAGKALGHGSDLHERWSHPQCVADRDRLLRVLLRHVRAHPHQTLLLLGGDVHSGAAFQIDFKHGPRVLQLTASAISNHESALLSWTSELAARTVSQIDGDDDIAGQVQLLPGLGEAVKNPFGDLNIGLVDVTEKDTGVALRLRLMSHDGRGKPLAVYDSGEQRTTSPR